MVYLYQKGRLKASFNSCCPQSFALGASGEIQQGWAKKCKKKIFKYLRLPFVDLYHFVVLLRCWGEGSGLAV